MEKIDIVADQLQLDRALNKLIHNLVEESQLTLGETLSIRRQLVLPTGANYSGRIL